MLSYVNLANSEPKHKSATWTGNTELDSALTFRPPQASQTKMCAPARVEAQKSEF
jgi:hypothetical protein